VATGQQLGTLQAAGAGEVYAVAFSPDGKMIATTGTDGVAHLWHVATHHQIGATPPSNLGFKSVAFSPDGKTLATAGNNKVRLWTVSSGILTQSGTPLASGNDVMHAVAFSPDGRTAATANDDGTARLWDVATQQQIGAPLTASPGGVKDVAFSPDGKALATASGDGMVQLWDIALPKDKYLANAVCSISGRSLKRSEWANLVKSVPFQKICP
jgi:WD40 repeat protein